MKNTPYIKVRKSSVVNAIKVLRAVANRNYSEITSHEFAKSIIDLEDALGVYSFNK